MVKVSQIIATGSAAGSVRGQTGSSWVDDFQAEVKPVYNNETDSYSYQMELPDWCPPEVHNYNTLTIPATGRIAAEPFFPADGPRDGVIMGLALDGKPIWSPNYQYESGAYCDGGVITSILTDTCNEIMGLGYVKAPICLFNDCLAQMNDTCVEEVTVGVALDGFPIKISKKCHNNADVDECGGMMDEDGNYAYYFTDEWPYSLRCFKGTPMVPLESGFVPEDVGQTSCPILYDQIRELNHFAAHAMSEMDKKDGDVNGQRTTRGRQSGGSGSDPVGKLIDMFDDVANSVLDIIPMGMGLLDDFNNGGKTRKRRFAAEFMNKLTENMQPNAANSQPNAIQRMKAAHEDKIKLPMGVYNNPVLFRCFADEFQGEAAGTDCINACDKVNDFGCDPAIEGDEVCNKLGYGLWNEAVVCEGIGRFPLKENDGFLFKKDDGMMAPRKSIDIASRMEVHSVTAYETAVTPNTTEPVMAECACHNLINQPFITKQIVFSEDATNLDLATSVGCGLCPANLIQIDGPATWYQTCEQPEKKFEDFPKSVFNGKHALDENFPLQSRCSCPEGLVWSFAQMWCVQKDECLPSEIGISVGCETKSKALLAMGHPPLDCDITDPESKFPAENCAYFEVDGVWYKESWPIDEFGDPSAPESFIEVYDENEYKDGHYHLKDDEWCSDWFNNSPLYTSKYNNMIEQSTSEYFGEGFFEEIGCAPVRMIVSTADKDYVHDGEEFAGRMKGSYGKKDKYEKIYGETSKGMYFEPADDWSNGYASINCRSSTEDDENVFQCKDIKVKFICNDLAKPDYYDEDEMAVEGDDYGYGSGEEDNSYGYNATDYTTSAPEYELDDWDKQQVGVEALQKAYQMVSEEYSCRLLWLEKFQNDVRSYGSMMTENEMYDCCCASIEKILRPCYMRWENEEWATEMVETSYPEVVNYAIMWEKQNFCQDPNEATETQARGVEIAPKQYSYYDMWREAMEKYTEKIYAMAFDNKWNEGYNKKCWAPMAELTKSNDRDLFNRETCIRTQATKNCIKDEVEEHIESIIDYIEMDTDSYWTRGSLERRLEMPRFLFDILTNFNPQCEAFFPPEPICEEWFSCSLKHTMNIWFECEKTYQYAYAPLGDETPHAMLRTGICVGLKTARDCIGTDMLPWEWRDIPHSPMEFDFAVRKLEMEIKDEIPPIAFTMVNMFRSKMPKTIDELVNLIKYIASQVESDVPHYIKMFEHYLGMTFNELVLRCCSFMEESFCDNPELHPIRNVIEKSFMQPTWEVFNGECTKDVCHSVNEGLEAFYFGKDNCGKNHGEKGLHFHLRIKEFLSDLVKEIMENGNLPDSWKMAIRYGLPEVMKHIKPCPAPLILVQMELDNLFEAYTREVNIAQYFCHPYPAQWEEWGECTSFCRETSADGFMSAAGVQYRQRACHTSDGEQIEYDLGKKMCAPEPLVESQICNDFPCPEPDVCKMVGTELDCSNADLKRLPFKIENGKYHLPSGETKKLKDVTKIKLCHNDLTDECWSEICNLLQAAENKIADIDLSYNNFSFVPEEFFYEMKKGSNICLSHNNIEEVRCDGQVGPMAGLEEGEVTVKPAKNMIVDFCHNPIKTLPFDLGRFLSQSILKFGTDENHMFTMKP